MLIVNTCNAKQKFKDKTGTSKNIRNVNALGESVRDNSMPKRLQIYLVAKAEPWIVLSFKTDSIIM